MRGSGWRKITATNVARMVNTDVSTSTSTMPAARRRQKPATRTRTGATAAVSAGAMGSILLAEISERVAQNRKRDQRRSLGAQDARPEAHRREAHLARRLD